MENAIEKKDLLNKIITLQDLHRSINMQDIQREFGNVNKEHIFYRSRTQFGILKPYLDEVRRLRGNYFIIFLLQGNPYSTLYCIPFWLFEGDILSAKVGWGNLEDPQNRNRDKYSVFVRKDKSLTWGDKTLPIQKYLLPFRDLDFEGVPEPEPEPDLKPEPEEEEKMEEETEAEESDFQKELKPELINWINMHKQELDALREFQLPSHRLMFLIDLWHATRKRDLSKEITGPNYFFEFLDYFKIPWQKTAPSISYIPNIFGYKSRSGPIVQNNFKDYLITHGSLVDQRTVRPTRREPKKAEVMGGYYRLDSNNRILSINPNFPESIEKGYQIPIEYFSRLLFNELKVPLDLINIRNRLQKEFGLSDEQYDVLFYSIDQKDPQKPPEPPIQPKLPEPPIHLEPVTSEIAIHIKKCVQLLNIKKQIIITGPPGTGKTFIAKKIANEITRGIGKNQFFIQFHPEYSYENFIECLRVKTGTTMDLEPTPQIFRNICEKALQDSKISLRDPPKYVLIIDEINRGDLSRIFGETIMGLEYRGELIKTMYFDEKHQLVIPENLYLIGTMNSVDRSIALVDFALRRRFLFYTLQPDRRTLEQWLDINGASIKHQILDLFDRLNGESGWIAETWKSSPHLVENYRIGHTYFFQKSEDEMQFAWEYSIVPLLMEYMNFAKETVDSFKKMFNLKDPFLKPNTND